MIAALRTVAGSTARRRLGVAGMLALCGSAHVTASELNPSCVVSVLNRSAEVQPDGSWVLPNIPANIGRVRARATCVENGVTRSGQSDYFIVPLSGAVQVPAIRFDDPKPVPSKLTLTAPQATLAAVGATVQLSVVATYPSGPTLDVTAAARGTNYTSSNPAVASVSADGLVTARTGGVVLVTVLNDGASALLRLSVVLSGDTDGDGISDDVELANGLDPTNPLDALQDFDHDGLTNLQEIQLGTNLRRGDSDGDGLPDGREVALGTEPLVFDTDGDGLGDGLEVATGSDPLDPDSYNLARALQSLDVNPSAVTLLLNTLLGEASRQLRVTGHLIDGNSLDLTARRRGTQYTSSDLTIASFGGVDGQVFAGNDGAAIVTVSNSGFSAQVSVTVQSFAPTPLSFVSLPGFANAVDVVGDFAYVAAGAAGLHVVDVLDRENPRLIATVDTPGNADDVKVVGGRAYVADGDGGLRIFDVSDPASPALLGVLDTPGQAQGIAVAGPRAYLADGSSGLQVIDVSIPSTPLLLGSLDTPGIAKGVDVRGALAAIADGGSGLRLVDVSNPAAPASLGSLATTDARDLVLDEGIAYLADFNGSLRIVDISTPATPQLLTSTSQSLGGILTDVARSRSFVFGADVFFVNGVPITEVSDPRNPLVRARLDFPARDDNGTGIAVDEQYVYLAADRSIQENGTSGDSRLYVGQYLKINDEAGLAPNVQILSPAAGSQHIAGTALTVRASATDDVGVAAVTFLVDGVPAHTDPTPPFEFVYTFPADASAVTFGATATDFGGNQANAAPVTVAVVPDPGTTVIGVISDSDGLPQEGATVTCQGSTVASGAGGAFSLSGVPTISGSIACSARLVLGDGTTLRGSSTTVPPVVGGTTNVGTIVLGRPIYLGYNPQDAARLQLLGWTDGTTYRLVALDDGRTVASGTLARFEAAAIPLSGVRHFRLETSQPVLATYGFDCCGFGGSFFYPALDGVSQVGRNFVFRIPVLSGSNEFVILAREESDIAIRSTSGGVVFATHLAAGGFFSTTGGPLAVGTAYQLESSGDVSLMSNSRNAYTVVPARDGRDVGTDFLFATLNWGPSGTAVFAYEDATVTATSLRTGAVVFTRTLSAGQVAYVSGIGEDKFRLVSSGRVAVWAGSTEGSDGIDGLGDDATVNTGAAGRELFVHGQSQGAFLLALDAGTHVNVDGQDFTLDPVSFRDLSPGVLHHIVADRPVVVVTIGGNGLNDWEAALRLVGR